MEARSSPAEPLLERTEERQQISALLDAALAGEGGAAVIVGVAGLGKTKLLEAASADAEAKGATVLLARASPLEREFAFGVARQLLEAPLLGAEPAVREELLSGAAHQAGAALDLDLEVGQGRDLHTTVHGLYWLLVNLCAEAPLIVAVDDLQWADEPSLRWLAYAARRLERLPIALLATARRTPGGAFDLPDDATDATRNVLGELVGDRAALRIEPGPLSSGAVRELLAARLGQDPDEAFAEACREGTGGNPFLLSELIAEVDAKGIAPTASTVGSLANLVPERVGETIRRHLERLSADAASLAASLAVLADGSDLAVAAELAGMDLGRAAAAASELVAAQILVDAPEPRFRHPLLQSAVRAQTPALDLAARHGRAAELLVARGAPSGRVATHLLAATPAGAQWAVDQLRAAARSARAQGATVQAAALLRRALLEPPPDEQRVDVLRELGAVELDLLDADAAEHLRQARELTTDPRERAALAVSIGLAYYYGHRHADGVELLLAAIEEARAEPELREEWLRLEALLGLVGRYDLETEAQTRGRVVALAGELSGETPGERQVLAIAHSERPGPSADGLYRATLLTERAAAERPWPDPVEGIGTLAMYVHAGRPDAAREYVDSLYASTLDTGSPMRYSIAIAARAALAVEVGDLRAAEADLEAALAIWRELDEGVLTRTMVGFQAVVLAGLGRPDEAEERFAESDLAGEVPRQMFFNPLLFQRGSVRLWQRRFAEAEDDFRELGRRHESWGISRPSPPWRSAAALALVGLGRAEEARKLAAEELELARAWDTPKSISFATRALALASDGEEAIEGLEEAVSLLEGTQWKLDRARARCDLGAALRRSGRRRDAREALTLAMDEAHACGAAPLAELAADELRASGARPRRRAISGRDALTPSELRVASLAAAGLTNRAIAEQLFVTLATVETHLSRTYRKLGIAGRSGLTETFAEPGSASTSALDGESP